MGLLAFPNRLFLLALFMFGLPTLKLRGRADEQLIRQECHNAEAPTVCIQCLESDPTSQQADKAGIATIIINCLNSHLHTLSNNVSSLAATEKHKAKKSALEDCGKGFVEAKKDLREGEKGLRSGDYDRAGNFVRVALDNPLACEAALKSIRFEDPSSVVTYEIKVYEELSVAALRIIDRL